MLTNGVKIPLSINFFYEDFYSSVQQEFETSEDQKSSLKLVIVSFLTNLKSKSDYKFDVFLSDSEFHSCENFGILKQLNFSKVFIPLNSRNQKNTKINDLDFNTNGIPL